MGNGNYAVQNVSTSQTTRLDATNKPVTFTVVTFFIGSNGPFSLTFAPGQYSSDAVVQNITATVNALKAVDTALAQLNSQA